MPKNKAVDSEKPAYLTDIDPLSVLSASQLRQLLHISTQLNSTVDLNQLLLMIVRMAADLVGTEAASVMLLDRKTWQLNFLAATDMPHPVKILVPMEGSLAGHIVLNKQPLISNDVQADTRHFNQIDQSTNFSTRNMIGVPILYKNEVIGVLEALNKGDNLPYEPTDVIILQALASQVAVAIENARLFQQSDMMAEIMHELKTPMMALMASSDLLIGDGLSADVREELIMMIHQEANRLTRITDEYLDMARLESGRLLMARKMVNVCDLVSEAVSLVKLQAQEQGIEIGLALPASTLTMVGDEMRLKQVLLNLLTNAIKYNHANGQVWVTLIGDDEQIEIGVRDSGVGIAPEHLPKLFTRFYRAPGSEYLATNGTGLGLFVARKIVQEHQGVIEVETAIGKGSTFTVRLPAFPNPKPISTNLAL